MGLEKTAERIREEAKEECAGIIAQANADAEKMLEAARAEGRRVSDRIMSKGQDDARFAGEKLVTDARLEANRKKMRLQSELIQKAIVQAGAALERFAEGKEYPPVLEKLALEAASLIGEKNAVVVVRKKDAKHLDLKKLSKAAGVQLEFAKHAADVPGVVVESVDGTVRVDNTCVARMRLEEGALMKTIAATLFGGQ